MQSIDDVYTKLYALRVNGVKTHQKFPPYTFNTSDYPLLFFRNIELNMFYKSALKNNSIGGRPTMLGISSIKAELIIILEAFRQGTSVKNYSKSREIMNSLVDAINSSDLIIDVETMLIKEDFEISGDTVLYVIKSDIILDVI